MSDNTLHKLPISLQQIIILQISSHSVLIIKPQNLLSRPHYLNQNYIPHSPYRSTTPFLPKWSRLGFHKDIHGFCIDLNPPPPPKQQDAPQLLCTGCIKKCHICKYPAVCCVNLKDFSTTKTPQ